MATTTIQINTRKYQASHGTKPRQSREYPVSYWAFQIDDTAEVFQVKAAYTEAAKQAKQMAKYSITVLP